MLNQVRTSDVNLLLRTEIQEILYCEPDEIAGDTEFADLGLDSVLGAELIAKVNQEYGLRERIQVLDRFTSVDQLTSYLTGRVNGEPGGPAGDSPR